MNVVIEDVKERVYAEGKKIRVELQSIEDRDGIITPQAVVNFARNKHTELHKEFEWDDKVAGDKYRLHQARNLLRAVVIDLTPNKEPTIVKGYINFDADENTERGYVSMQRVMSSKELYQRMLKMAKDEAELFAEKYVGLKELSSVRREISKFLAGGV